MRKYIGVLKNGLKVVVSGYNVNDARSRLAASSNSEPIAVYPYIC